MGGTSVVSVCSGDSVHLLYQNEISGYTAVAALSGYIYNRKEEAHDERKIWADNLP